jgi:drug/metabolite transporter (DMT)-like permease
MSATDDAAGRAPGEPVRAPLDGGRHGEMQGGRGALAVRRHARGAMSLLALLLLVIFLVGTATGQLLFKAASVRAHRQGGEAVWRALALEPLLWLGVAIYVFEFLVWLAFLSMVPLWQAVMLANFDILLVMVCGRIFFGEQITRPRAIGVSLIAIGVIMVGWGA